MGKGKGKQKGGSMPSKWASPANAIREAQAMLSTQQYPRTTSAAAGGAVAAAPVRRTFAHLNSLVRQRVAEDTEFERRGALHGGVFWEGGRALLGPPATSAVLAAKEEAASRKKAAAVAEVALVDEDVRAACEKDIGGGGEGDLSFSKGTSTISSLSSLCINVIARNLNAFEASDVHAVLRSLDPHCTSLLSSLSSRHKTQADDTTLALANPSANSISFRGITGTGIKEWLSLLQRSSFHQHETWEEMDWSSVSIFGSLEDAGPATLRIISCTNLGVDVFHRLGNELFTLTSLVLHDAKVNDPAAGDGGIGSGASGASGAGGGGGGGGCGGDVGVGIGVVGGASSSSAAAPFPSAPPSLLCSLFLSGGDEYFPNLRRLTLSHCNSWNLTVEDVMDFAHRIGALREEATARGGSSSSSSGSSSSRNNSGGSGGDGGVSGGGGGGGGGIGLRFSTSSHTLSSLEVFEIRGGGGWGQEAEVAVTCSSFRKASGGCLLFIDGIGGEE